jgi:type II secretory pathway pseudopilin PulG
MNNRRWIRRLDGDDGTTLIELMVGMVLMSIFLAMFTGAVVMMNTAMNKSQAVTLTASQLDGAFHHLDRLVRYAAAISPPGLATTGIRASGDWYVELSTTNSGRQVCTQLRVDTVAEQLQQRTWEVRAAVAAKPGSWVPISSGISNGGAVKGPTSQPFYLVPVRANTMYQQMTFNLAARSGSGAAQSMSTSSFSVTATNSSMPPPISPVCQEWGRP